MLDSDLRVFPYSSKYGLKGFDCGEPELNDYLLRFAGQNHRKGIGRTYLGIRDNSVCGFFTVGMAEIIFQSLPESLQKRVPRYPLPAMRIGRLAVDKKFKGQGIGEFLLMDALALASKLYTEIGIFCVTVDAKNSNAIRFYKNYGFIPFLDRKDSLFLPIKTILKIFPETR